MDFSVIIPAFNEEKNLRRLLPAILLQTKQPLEIIIADADSQDQTVSVAESFGAKVVKGGLPSVGRNSGARHAKADVLFFLDADVDLIDNDFFAKALIAFKKQKLDIATVDVKPIAGNLMDKISHTVYNVYVRLWGKRHPHAPGFCIIINKDLHNKIGGFDEEIVFCEDHDYAYRAGKYGKFGFLRGLKIGVSVRRMEKDGRLNIFAKYILAELHLLFLGPIKGNKFNYDFDYSKYEERHQKK
ncbi:glycosyltransferase [Candidatus Parcubacteria bacterium]|nr:MAG: glycosyltransferase [Candidatus Parcubacteria bacterium]